MKCCANCEWCISPDLEEEIMQEQGYTQDDPNKPYAGECSIGMQHNGNYYCSSHTYLDGMEEEIKKKLKC